MPRIRLEPVQCREHRRENADEQHRDFFDGMEVEMIRVVHLFARAEIRADCSRDHQPFAQKCRLIDEYGCENDAQKPEVSQSFKTPLIVLAGEMLANLLRRAAIIQSVHYIKYRQQDSNSHQKHRIAM